MAKNEYKMPERFRKFVEPILLKEELILCTLRESFSFFGESILPKWAILTNLRLMILTRDLPGIRMDEFHLENMTVELFQNRIGFYNSIEFLLRNKPVCLLEVAHKRWEEAEKFVHELSKNIGQLEYEARSENDTVVPSDSESAKVEKRHLRDLERMGVISEKEYNEDVNKPYGK